MNGKIVGNIETSQLRTSEANIRLGLGAALNGQQTSAIAIGSFAAGTSLQGDSAIAIGMYAGDSGQGARSTAIGYQSGQTTQGTNSVAMGRQAGQNTQGNSSVALGFSAGKGTQGNYAVALGSGAAYSGQGANAIAIGYDSGLNNQGTSSIAIGYNAGWSMHDNSIVINATGGAIGVNSAAASSFVVKPIRNAVNANYLQYNSTSGEITYTTDLALDGVLTGSVFGDDSTLLVDGINNKLIISNNTTDDLPEGTNNKYFTNGRAIAMTIVFG